MEVRTKALPFSAVSEGEGRYSPAEVARVEVVPVMGQPIPNEYALRLSNVKTSASEWVCAGSLGKRMPSKEVGESLGSGRVLVRVLQLSVAFINLFA